jgi:putative transposase
VVGELLGDLLERGLDFTAPRLYVLDGGKALMAAVKKYAGETAAIQRCQVHKRRNVLDHLTDEQKPEVARKLNAAYGLEDYAAAQQALIKLHRELMDLNPADQRPSDALSSQIAVKILTINRVGLPCRMKTAFNASLSALCDTGVENHAPRALPI